MAVGRAVQMGSDGRQGLLSFVGLYGELGGGLAVGRSHFRDVEGTWTSENDLGVALSAGAGLVIRSPWETGWGGSIGYDFAYSPSVTNDIGDRHASGGHRFHISFGASF
jgi:hypothetical protein